MGLEHERLLSLIEFAKESAKLKGSPVCDASTYLFHAYEHNLQGLPGLHFNAGGDEQDLWLVVDRLKETSAPQPKKPALQVWIELSNNPAKEPTLKPAIELSKLLDAGLIELKPNHEPIDGKKLVLLQDFENATELESFLKAYLQTQWTPWSEEEKKRRKTIQLYGKLFTLKQQLEGSISDAQVEIAWGVGVAVWNMNKSKVSYPLLTKLVDININETMAIEIRPREVDTQLEIDIYSAVDNPGTPELEKIFKAFAAKKTQTFSPFDGSTFEPFLRSSVACLDSKGIYWPSETTSDNRDLPVMSPELKVTDTWVLIARPRSKNLFIQDLERFKSELENQEQEITLPKAILSVLTEPSSQHDDIVLPTYRGISIVSGSDGEDRSSKEVLDLFFPMPFNDEQVRIVQLLERYDGVIVQGPPGTGKTHTIANIIAHYFALGKRVLVTSMKEPALSVLRDQLPEEIRPLAISLLSNEQEGMKQFEHAVSRIASEIQVIDKAAYRKEISRLEESIDSFHSNLARIDRKVTDWAKKNLNPIVIDGRQLSPADAAREVINGTGQYEWLPDKLDIGNAPRFDNVDIVRVREARRLANGDLTYLDLKLPEINSFNDPRELLRLHQDLSRHAIFEEAIKGGELPPLADSKKETVEDACILLDKVKLLFLHLRDANAKSPARLDARKVLKGSAQTLPAILEIFDALGAELKEALNERNNFIARPVTLPVGADLDGEIVKAVGNRANGKSPFGLAGFVGKSASKKKLEEIRVVSNAPQSEGDWSHVKAYIDLQQRFRQLVTRWNSIAGELAVECLPNGEPVHVTTAAELYLSHRKLRDQLVLENEITEQSHRILPAWKKHSDIEHDMGCLQELESFLESHTSKHRLASAAASKEQLHSIFVDFRGNIIEQFAKFISTALGNPKVSDGEIQEQWARLINRLREIHGLRSAFNDIRDICSRIEQSGAEKWAKQLQSESPYTTIDHLLPDNWQNAWHLRRLATYLEKADAREELKELANKRRDAEKLLEKTYRGVIAKRTWLKLAENATPDIRAALEAFRTAISKIGKGTGKRATIFRQNARNASERANRAIPCWIMPHWRVSEALPAQLGCFDLVIIDEASQSDLSALPALLRAKKILIVGDDKQVSPDGGFIEVDKIKNLMARYLTKQVDIFRAQMDPGQSIYDLFKVVFAQSGIMLKEHFRCVGPIIEYSKREVYNHELKPVRLPKASERLDPPLIDVLIEDGFRKGDLNHAEARFIVDEIKKICADERMYHRTIGVVSLLADKQALEIWKMLENELGPEEIGRHEITCGDARTFQGKERDIMFLTMVVSPGDAHAQTKESTAQRFNVAASRARDRMYLVRSIELDQLSPADKLRRGLISHFATPYLQDEAKVETLRALCESEFELEVYDLLTERGYRVIPQVKVGEYRIDMVVEGHNDARLAVECDGDRYHGADKWEDDMNRQRILERVGWQFWRSFASTFVRNRREVVDDLIQTLSDKGIEPIGSDAAPRSIHTEHRRITVFPMNDLHVTDRIIDEPIAEAV